MLDAEAKPGSSLADLEKDAESVSCPRMSTWIVNDPKPIASGAHGKIVPISPPEGWTTTGTQYAQYVFKEGFNKADQLDIKKEVDIMTAAKKCPLDGYAHVMEATASAPCINTPSEGTKILPYALISPRMHGTLKQWAVLVPHPTPGCVKKISEQIIRGLSCLHASNYVHGDLKVNNLLFGHLEDGCPADVRVTDFGLSTKIRTKLGTQHYMRNYGNEQLHKSVHLYAGMFDGGAAFAGNPRVWQRHRSVDPNHFARAPLVDWCSFIFMMLADFSTPPEDSLQLVNTMVGPTGLSKGDCGQYGPHRTVTIP